MVITERNEREYRSLMMRIGGSLLLFLLLIYVSQSLFLHLSTTLPREIGEKRGFLISNLLYASMYFASFALPVLFFYLISKRKHTEPMQLAPRLTANTPLLIFASIGMILACSAVNNIIIEPFISPSFDYSELFVSYDYSEPYKVVVQFIAISLVPGICEELLFRGMILGNLLPYGKTGAIVASAFLFGLMHQNPLQMFYATMAGLILGFLCVYTRSILCSTLVHILNNGFSVLLGWMGEALGDDSAWQILLLQSIVFLLAALSIVLLLVRHRSFWKKPDLNHGVFGKVFPEEEGYQRIPIDPSRKIRLFFAPTIVIFIVSVAIQMASLMLILMIGEI